MNPQNLTPEQFALIVVGVALAWLAFGAAVTAAARRGGRR